MAYESACAECTKKQRQIDKLTEENQQSNQPLRYRERENLFGSQLSAARLASAHNPMKEQNFIRF